jgi:hypothetical protein
MTTAQAHTKAPLARCFFQKSNGSRCRRLVTNTLSHFCASHVHVNPSPTPRPTPQQNQPVDIDLSTELGLAAPGGFASPEEIYDFLGKLTFLVSANRISSRRAAVLAYITGQVLRTSCVLQKMDATEYQPTIVIDVPRPRRPTDETNSSGSSAESAISAS